MKMNIKDLPIGKEFPEKVNAVIEVPKGSNQKYEYNESSGTMELNRVLHSSLYYPASYGFIPKTRAEDDDHLDVLVLTDFVTPTGSTLIVRPIGMIVMEDENKVDNKIIALPIDDLESAMIQEIKDLDKETIEKITHFFRLYKKLEEKVVHVGKWLDKAAAHEMIKETNKVYIEEAKIS